MAKRDSLKSGLSASIRTLPLAERLLVEANVMAYPPVVPAVLISEKMSPFRLRGDITVAVDYKMSMIGGYVAARRADADGPFQETEAALLDAAGDDLATKRWPFRSLSLPHSSVARKLTGTAFVSTSPGKITAPRCYAEAQIRRRRRVFAQRVASWAQRKLWPTKTMFCSSMHRDRVCAPRHGACNAREVTYTVGGCDVHSLVRHDDAASHGRVRHCGTPRGEQRRSGCSHGQGAGPFLPLVPL